ncbi:MAG: oligopeptide transporter, OPT family [Muribaculaceae bacterium]|nr:oligopeptide transporter, OPT family [Muribaculaceae bacterium]
MEEIKETDLTALPENAFRELGKDEEYRPILHPAHDTSEVTPYSVGMGLLLAIIFSAAAAYLGLRVGQVFEAAIPIAIIAVGLSQALKKENPLGQNVIIQSIGACSGVIVAGAIFTLPALYILQGTYPEITVNFVQIFLSSLLGGVLGILFFIPFRKYFVKDMHGKYPFPEATATTQVLVSAQAKGSGSQAKTLIVASLIGGIYDYVVATFGWWAETISTTATSWGASIAEKAKVVLSCNTGAALLGLGYIVGLKYAFVIFAGSIFVWWIIVPLMGTSAEMSALAPQQIFSDYARMIGIGGIAMAGVIGIIKSWPIIMQAVGLAAREFKGGAETKEKPVRWQTDLSMKAVVAYMVLALAVVFMFFWIGVIGTLWQAAVAWLVVTLIAFLFTTVAANAIAIVGSNPVSGMTLMTLIIASAIFVGIGLSGTSGIVAAMVIGGVVCTALSMAGGFVTDLKIGYWVGSTPRKQETWKFLGTLVSAATVGGVILLLNDVYGFYATDIHPDPLVAPQANAMAKVIEPLMMGGDTPWILYFCGAVLALLLNWLGVPALAFCLGMFIPLSLNTPMLVGGAIAWFVSNSSKDKATSDARRDRGTLLASGLIAGGALFGVFAALTKFLGYEYANPLSDGTTQLFGLVMYALLICYLWWDSCRAKKLA